MSQFRVEKRRAEAELTLSSGETRRGCFFLAASRPSRTGPERVKDVLNGETGFFPFETGEPAGTILVNRSHLVAVRLIEAAGDVYRDSGHDVAKVHEVALRLTSRQILRGTVRVHRPAGLDRLSDDARGGEPFRYVENADGTYIVNSAHVIEEWEIPS